MEEVLSSNNITILIPERSEQTCDATSRLIDLHLCFYNIEISIFIALHLLIVNMKFKI